MIAAIDVALSVAGWCLADYLLVKSPGYPRSVQGPDWAIWLALLLLLALNYAVASRRRLKHSVAVSVAALVTSVPITLILILSVGIWFHFSIGGRF